MPAEVANPVERYIELAALETMLTSGLALGQFFDDHIKTIDSLNDDHIDVKAGDNPSLDELFSLVCSGEDEETVEQLLIEARIELLMATMLRSIMPRRVAEAADYFHQLGTEKTAAAHRMMRGEASDAS